MTRLENLYKRREMFSFADRKSFPSQKVNSKNFTLYSALFQEIIAELAYNFDLHEKEMKKVRNREPASPDSHFYFWTIL